MARCGNCQGSPEFLSDEEMFEHMEKVHGSKFVINPFTGEKVK